MNSLDKELLFLTMKMENLTQAVISRLVYIKYDADLKQGDRVETVLVYNPATNFDDDMMYRADTLIK